MSKNPEKIYKCKYCEQTFFRTCDIANHIRNVHKKIKFKRRICEICGKEITAHPAIYSVHLRKCKEDNKSYFCKKCGKLVTKKFGSGVYCSQECANGKKHSEETRKRISIKSIEFLGTNFYIDKLNRVLISLIKKKTQQEHIQKNKITHVKQVCPVCGIYYTENTICRECLDYKKYIDFKHGRISIKFSVAKRLLEKYEGHKCSICGITNWNNKYLTMICDHIDGHCFNNTYQNLRLICSNCDSQLPTYKSKNKISDRKTRKKYRRE